MIAHWSWPICAIAVLNLVATAYGGELNPTGPPEPTANLAEPHIPIRSLPVTILESGSYIFVNDLAGGAASGITISASHVTLDLNGFSLVGDGSTNNADGISIGGGATLTDITIQNGRVRDWGACGVEAYWQVGGLRLDNLTLESNALEGISVMEGPCVITDCVAIGNGTSSSFAGISANSAMISDCSASGNSGAGIFAYQGAVTGCTAMENGAEGIHAAGASVIACSAMGNQGAGIYARDGSVVSDCTARSNQGDGFLIEWGTTIRGCTAFRNLDDGIDVASDCLVVGNHCTENLGGASAGILVRGDNNCIDGNLLLNQATGINVIGSDNLIIRNRARGNSSANYQDSGTGTNMAQRLYGGVNFTSADPWANFDF